MFCQNVVWVHWSSNHFCIFLYTSLIWLYNGHFLDVKWQYYRAYLWSHLWVWQLPWELCCVWSLLPLRVYSLYFSHQFSLACFIEELQKCWVPASKLASHQLTIFLDSWWSPSLEILAGDLKILSCRSCNECGLFT